MSFRPGLNVSFDIIADIPEGMKLVQILVWDIDAEILLHRHNHFDNIERIGAEIVGDIGEFTDIIRVAPKLIHNNIPDSIFYGIVHSFVTSQQESSLSPYCFFSYALLYINQSDFAIVFTNILSEFIIIVI